MDARPARTASPESGNPEEADLQRQLQTGFRWLRFEEPLEALFRDDFEQAALTGRKTLLAVAIVLVAVTPLYDWTMGMPAAFNRFTHVVQLGFEVPALALALLLTHWPRTQRWSVAVSMLAVLALVAGLVAQRVVGRQYGFEVPHNFAALTLASTFLMGSVRLSILLPWVLAVTTAICVVEFAAFGAGGAEIYAIVSIVFTMLLAMFGGYYLEYLWRSNWLQRKLLERQALADALTGLFNRREFMRIVDRFVRLAARDGKPVALMMLDVDCFKEFNDCYGHPAGDECLRRIGHVLTVAGRRPLDLQGRLGGEEFAIVWYDIDSAVAAQLAQRVCDAVHELQIPHARSTCASVVTISAGLFWCRPGRDMTAQETMVRADALLYRAKHEGRNRLVAGAFDDEPAALTPPR